jgi:hypothetical protein
VANDFRHPADDQDVPTLPELLDRLVLVLQQVMDLAVQLHKLIDLLTRPQ